MQGKQVKGWGLSLEEGYSSRRWKLAGRKVVVRRKADVSPLFVKTPFSSTASCLQMRLPVVLKELGQVPVFTGLQLPRWVLVLGLIKRTEKSPSPHRASACSPACPACWGGAGSCSNSTSGDVSPEQQRSVSAKRAPDTGLWFSPSQTAWQKEQEQRRSCRNRAHYVAFGIFNPEAAQRKSWENWCN